MDFYRTFLIFVSIFPHVVIAQEIAIIDQGKNTLKRNNGEFYNPVCFGEPSFVWSNPFTGSISPNLNGTDVVITQASLCDSVHTSRGNRNGSVPMYWSFNDLNANGQPFTSVTMAVTPRLNSPRTVSFRPPFKNIELGGALVHGTHVANAAHEFDSSIRKKMMQVYYIDSVRSNDECAPITTLTINKSTAAIGGPAKILEALNEIINDPDGVDAINMSIVFRQPCSFRQQNDFTPQACDDSTGQDEVQDLRDLGIPFVVGLLNKDIGTNEETWPACLSGVIKVGSENDNSNIQNGGIGIGANGIDFYAKNTVSANRGAAGNSMAAPRIAAAYALLKTAVPNSTIEQRTEALRLANSRTNTYKRGNTRRYVKKTDIPDAIEELNELTGGNIDNIYFEDTRQYGSIYGDDSSNYSFEINFDELIGSNNGALRTTTVLSPPNARDVVLSFDAKMSNSQFFKNGFNVYINNVRREGTGYFANEKSFEYILHRNFFNASNNTIRIQPLSASSSRLWGISNVKAEFTPVIPLTLGQTNTNEYGYDQTPTRYTGMRASFDLDNTNNDVLLSMNAWDIDVEDETSVFINGTGIGNVKQGASSAYVFDSFLITKDLLEDGQNVIELVQRRTGNGWDGYENEKWAVKDLLVQNALPDLTAPIVGVIDRSLKASTPFSVNAMISNIGLGSSDATMATFRISVDENITMSDSQIGSLSIGRLLPNTNVNLNTTLQTPLVNQGYYLGVCVNAVVGETNGSNNCSEGVPLKNNVVIPPVIMWLLED